MLSELESARYIDCLGDAHRLTLDDILVVTPFNAQVKCLGRRKVPGCWGFPRIAGQDMNLRPSGYEPGELIQRIGSIRPLACSCGIRCRPMA